VQLNEGNIADERLSEAEASLAMAAGEPVREEEADRCACGPIEPHAVTEIISTIHTYAAALIRSCNATAASWLRLLTPEAKFEKLVSSFMEVERFY
jgi:hypothetical protein